MRNEIVFVMDSVGWREFEEAKTPNLDKFSPERAYSFATYTCPSVNAMLRGSLPVPIERRHRYRAYPEFKFENAIIPLTLKNKGYNTYIVSSNLLIRNDKSKFGVEAVSGNGWFDYEIVDFSKEPSANLLVKRFLNSIKRPFYAFMIFIETHKPYMGKDKTRETQLKAIEYLDSVFKKLYNSVPKGTRIIVTSDHSDCWVSGASHGHNPKSYAGFVKRNLVYRLLEVFTVEVIK